jgi:hypothetical protein
VTKGSGGRGPAPGLFDAAGTARRLRASPLFAIGPAEPGPALRRGFLLAVPVGVCLAIELGFDAPTKGAVATGALLAAFPGMDAPAAPRAAWQAAAAPAIGLAAALGILSSQSGALAVLAMGLVGALAGYCFAYSLRLAIFGLSVSLALMIGQGFFLPVSETLPALLWGTVGGLSQVLWSLLVWIAYERGAREEPSGWDTRAVLAALRSNLSLESDSFRHAIRFGAALATGVAVYRIVDMENHGFWIPLTILFVMRPDRDETYLRLVLRAVGTALGLIVATALAETVGGSIAVVVVLLTLAAALSYGMLTVQYALFTAAITVYVVLMVDTLGEPALEAAGLRALGTAIGIAIAFLAWLVWPKPRAGRGLTFEALRPPPPAPESPAR